MKIRVTQSWSWSNRKTVAPATIVCAPIAHDIYEAILKTEKPDTPALAACASPGAAN